MSRARKVTVVAGTAVTAVGTAVVVALAPIAPAAAAPAPQEMHQEVATTNTLNIAIPAIGGIEFGPGATPGGSFQQVTVNARPAPTTLQYPPPPSAVTFSVQDPVPYHHQYTHRYLVVSWHNLATGESGEVPLRHWQHPEFEVSNKYQADLPTSANATTGSGPVVATVRVLRWDHHSPPQQHSIIPGVSALDVP